MKHKQIRDQFWTAIRIEADNNFGMLIDLYLCQYLKRSTSNFLEESLLGNLEIPLMTQIK